MNRFTSGYVRASSARYDAKEAIRSLVSVAKARGACGQTEKTTSIPCAAALATERSRKPCSWIVRGCVGSKSTTIRTSRMPSERSVA